MLRPIPFENIPNLRRQPVDANTLQEASRIVEDIRKGGREALTLYCQRFGDLRNNEPLLQPRSVLEHSAKQLFNHERKILERTGQRIREFAQAQRRAILDVSVGVPGGEAGHNVEAVDYAGCYAPGGRYPLPSTVLMTAVVAREAGVKTVIIASPRPSPIMLAAAGIAGADAFLSAGGAHAIAALAYGAGEVPACDVVVGPGNRWVTAAKKLVAGDVAIDMLAGPSELVIVADKSADPKLIAADLLAQAEHDPDAFPVLLTLHENIIEEVNEELKQQLETLSTREIAKQALLNGYLSFVPSTKEIIRLCNKLAPEHLQLMTEDAVTLAKEMKHYGSLFIGAKSAEVFGDYGAGPNHVLPTGGTARCVAGLSVATFLRLRTWLRIDDLDAASDLVQDAISLANLEGLAGHARAAKARLGGG